MRKTSQPRLYDYAIYERVGSRWELADVVRAPSQGAAASLWLDTRPTRDFRVQCPRQSPPQ